MSDEIVKKVLVNGEEFPVGEVMYSSTLPSSPNADLTYAVPATINPFPVAAGGTGATTAEQARINLGIGESKGYYAGTSAPTNTDLLWIDTSSGTPLLKYYNGSAWTNVGAVWS